MAIYSANLNAFSAAMMNKMNIEKGNKSTVPPSPVVILPASVLSALSHKKVQFPMFFKLSVPEKKRQTYCGVLEFVASESSCVLPGWVSWRRTSPPVDDEQPAADGGRQGPCGVPPARQGSRGLSSALRDQVH